MKEKSKDLKEKRISVMERFYPSFFFMCCGVSLFVHPPFLPRLIFGIIVCLFKFCVYYTRVYWGSNCFTV